MERHERLKRLSVILITALAIKDDPKAYAEFEKNFVDLNDVPGDLDLLYYAETEAILKGNLENFDRSSATADNASSHTMAILSDLYAEIFS